MSLRAEIDAILGKKRRATRLVDMEINRVDLVDRGANGRRFAIFKQDGVATAIGEEQRAIGKDRGRPSTGDFEPLGGVSGRAPVRTGYVSKRDPFGYRIDDDDQYPGPVTRDSFGVPITKRTGAPDWEGLL